MWNEEYKDCLDYISSYWEKIIIKPDNSIKNRLKNILSKRNLYTSKNANIINLPFTKLVPNNHKFNKVYYWDTFFMFKGILGSKYEWVMLEMIKNYIYLFEKYGLIPNYNALAGLSHSQPPFFTSMIIDTFLNKPSTGKGSRLSKNLFTKAIETAKNEYKFVWIDNDNLHKHKVKGISLARYGDSDLGYFHISELESGWDLTSRFYGRCSHFLPIDLNVYLFKYEKDFEVLDKYSGKSTNLFWHETSQLRKKAINDLLWNEKEGFYYDYDWYRNKQSEFLSLAGFTPLWAGIPTPQQAQSILSKLSFFETEAGLTITSKDSLTTDYDISKFPVHFQPLLEEYFKPKQWDYPNVWPPLEYLTIIGLLRYGYQKDAIRIMKNSIKTHAMLYRKYKTFFEKINSQTMEPGTDYMYENQEGFGWTNAVFYRYIQILDQLESGQNIYKQPKPQNPPYDLEIIH